MILYDAAWAPSPRRVRIFLAEKGIEIARRTIDLTTDEQRGAAYLAINPRGTLPALALDDGEVIADSCAICRYLEALHPSPALFGATPLNIARVEAWTRTIDSEGYAAVVFAYRNSSHIFADRAMSGAWPPQPQIAALADRGRGMWPLFVDRLERQLSGRTWIATDAYSYADLFALVTIDFAKATKVSLDPLPPALADWHARVSERPSAAA